MGEGTWRPSGVGLPGDQDAAAESGTAGKSEEEGEPAQLPALKIDTSRLTADGIADGGVPWLGSGLTDAVDLRAHVWS